MEESEAEESAVHDPRQHQTSRYSHALQRGLAIIAQFTSERAVLGIAEIADALGMSRATTHRYVTTLVAEGYLKRDESRKYRLAAGTVDLGMAALNAVGICKHAGPYMRDLAQRSEHTVDLAVLDGLEALVIDSARPRGAKGKSTANDEIGARLPLYCTSVGKILLAGLSPKRRRATIAAIELTPLRSQTITSASNLREQVEKIAAEEIAVDDEERLAGTCSIATSLRDETGDVVAALSLTAHHGESDLEGLIVRFSAELMTTGQRIARSLGWEEKRDFGKAKGPGSR
jgi:IclR family transcriptional regulator, pca regulon regulatory protein